MPKKKSADRELKIHAVVESQEVIDHIATVRKRAERIATRRKKLKKKHRKRLTAKVADHHDLYQRSVQSPGADVRFLRRMFKTYRGREPGHLREDFCGTALLAGTWVKRGPSYTAEGYDLDPDPLAWGLVHNFPKLGKSAARCTLRLKDVREPSLRPPDVRCAQNFSWFVFKERAVLLEYLRAVRADLPDHGVFVMDIQGGPESMQEMEEEVEHDGWTYVWDQKSYWPNTADYQTRIHFRFADGSELKNAFRYDWRLWGLAETVDLLREAGFGTVDTYWEGTDSDGETGNGIFRKMERGENCEAWVTYLVALP